MVYEEPEPSTQLVRRERRSEVLHPLDRQQLVASFREYQELCKDLLDDSDYQTFTQSEKQPDGSWQKVTKRFKKKSAFRKLATAFDLDVEKVELVIERSQDGRPLRARAVYRAIAPSGRYQDGDGYCSADEPRFSKDKSRERIENDLPATATTRAKNRAISDLLGTGEVSAEEMGGGHDEQAPPMPPMGPQYDRKQLGPVVGAACTQLTGGNPELGKALFTAIMNDCGGYMPQAAALAIIHCAERDNRAPDIAVDLDAPRTYPAQVIPEGRLD